LTLNGKVDRRALAVPDREAMTRTAYEAPQGETEQMLAALWQELLGVERVGRHDHFFELGGHSLLAVQLCVRVREHGVTLKVRQVFEQPVLASMSREAHPMMSEEDTPVARSRPNIVPQSWAQQRLWMMDRVYGSQAYAMPAAYRLQGPLDVEALRRALEAMVARHEVLRTCFATDGQLAVQRIMPPQSVELPLKDMQVPSDPTQATATLDEAFFSRPFDLANGPLFRTELHRHGPQDHTFLFVAHHIICDGTSVEILLKEVSMLYRAFHAGEEIRLDPLPLQYADYALWQQSWMQGERLASELAHWRQRLAGAPERLVLPVDYPRRADRVPKGAWAKCEIPRHVSDGVKKRSLEFGCTAFVILLAAFKVLLAQRSGQDDIVVGTDVANRNHAGIRDLVGFFVNQGVLRTRMQGNPRCSELLRMVHAEVLDLQEHQDLPFERIVEALRPARSPAHHPIFQVKFAYQTQEQTELRLDGVEVTEAYAGGSGIKECDLTLYVRHERDGMRCAFEYAADLFAQSTIDSMADEYVQLLTKIVEDPQIRLDTLSMERKPMAEHKSEDKHKPKRTLSGLRREAPKAITLSADTLVSLEPLREGVDLPYVIRAQRPGVNLCAWSRANKAEIDGLLLRHGALLCRGFDIDRPERLEAFASLFCDALYAENGEHPRVASNVYKPVRYPAEEKLLWHNENTFNLQWPGHIWFACAQPSEKGGETPLVDVRRVYQRLDPALREEFVRRGVMYVRNYHSGVGRHWHDVFGSRSRSEVEARCRDERLTFEWTRDDSLRTYGVRPAAGPHPRSGEMCWFNQIQHWHPHCLNPVTGAALRRLYEERDLPRTCYFGDGGVIEDAAIDHILAVYEELEVAFPWARGDVLLIDNFMTAHARNPYIGERRLFVAMGNMIRIDATTA
jgi:alpha-ketoglutarate-dependent taurine dioxygenase